MATTVRWRDPRPQLPRETHDALVPQFRACHNRFGRPKKRYRTGWHAQRIASEMEQLYGESMSAYRCPVCLRWHIGSKRV